LTLAGIATAPPNSEHNPTAFPTFLEWDKVKAAVDSSVDRPHPKAPELVSVNHLPWYPIQPSSVKKRLDHWEHRDVEKLAERPFSSLAEPRPRSNGGQDTFDVHHTLWLLYALLTGESPTAEEETMLHLHGLPAKYITFAVNQLTTGKDRWTEYNRFGMSERTFLRLLCDLPPGSPISSQHFKSVSRHYGVSLLRCNVQGHGEPPLPVYGLYPRGGTSWDGSDSLWIC